MYDLLKEAEKATGGLREEVAALNLDEDTERRKEQDEWEYEYSTTETETYYLTLELSYPEFKGPQTRAPHHSRGGYYKNWLDQNPIQVKLSKDAGTDDREREGETATNGNSNANNEDEDDRVPEQNIDDNDVNIDPQLLAETDKGKDVDRGDQVEGQDKDKEQEADKPNDDSNPKQEFSEEPPEDIQILELHSDHPIISYRGRVFEGSWAEVIGTEAIFAHHDERNPLPALRQLDGGVDLLAASASRILTKEKIVKPKIQEEDHLAPIREEWNIRIPVGKDRNGERAQQARFLENLIALKKKKGETDAVTVFAKDGEGKNFDDNRDPDYKPRRKRRILNEDGEEVVPSREQRRGGRRARRRSGQASGGRPRRARGGSTTLEAGSSATGRADTASALSTPTPARWEEMMERDEEYEEPGSDEDGSDIDDDGDVTMTV